MKKTGWGLLVAIFCSWLPFVSADTVIVDSDQADSYHFVDTYEVLINRPAEAVWPHLLDQASWMYEFDMTHESGPPNEEGEVRRLYAGEGFFVEIVKIVPEKMLLVMNHPSNMRGEESVGVAMYTLTEVNGATLVSSFMSRHYSWTEERPNPMRETRESEQFQEFNRVMWEDKFLNRLRELAEGTYGGD